MTVLPEIDANFRSKDQTPKGGAFHLSDLIAG